MCAMKNFTLGTTGIELPEICLGTMTWGQQNTEAEAHEQLSYAVDERGCTFLDTAEIYPIPPETEKQGRTETYIGNWLTKRGRRDDLFIASKVSPGETIQTREYDSPPLLDKKNIEAAIDGTLSRLQTDYVDLYQVHWPVRQTNFFGVRGYEHDPSKDRTPIRETLEALAPLIESGKVRHIGVSNETPWGVSEYLRLAREEGLPRIVSIQNQYSLTNRTYDIGLAEICLKENVSMLAYSVLNMGVLTGKYLDGAKPEGARFTLFERNSARYNPPNEHAQSVIKQYVELAQAHNLDPAHLAIKFALLQQSIQSVIIGATTMEQLKVCIDAAAIELSDDVLAAINQLYIEHPDVTA